MIMKKRGFTLVEVLAVIAVLAILLLFAVPMLMKARENTLNALSQNQRKNLKYAGETLGIDLDDYMSKIFNCKEGSWVDGKCTFVEVQEEYRKVMKWNTITLPLSELIEHEYFEDIEGHCKGNITVTKEDAGYKVDYSRVTC